MKEQRQSNPIFSWAEKHTQTHKHTDIWETPWALNPSPLLQRWEQSSGPQTTKKDTANRRTQQGARRHPWSLVLGAGGLAMGTRAL